jgi:hypothetical protein
MSFLGSTSALVLAPDMSVGGMGGIYPPRTSIPPDKTGWGYGNFFHVVNNFSGNLFFYLLAAGEIFGSWGGIYPPTEKCAHV